MRSVLVMATLVTIVSMLSGAACTAPAPAGVSQAEVEALVKSAVDKKLSEVDKKLSEVDKKFTEADTKLPLWGVQPGTAPRMMELTNHFNNMWYAAEAGNWLFAEFEVYRTDEIVKAIKVVRPKRVKEMNKWLEESIKPLSAAVKAKDLPRFTEAYDNAVKQCNECHADSTGGDISLKGVKVTRPGVPLLSNVDYQGIK